MPRRIKNAIRPTAGKTGMMSKIIACKQWKVKALRLMENTAHSAVAEDRMPQLLHTRRHMDWVSLYIGSGILRSRQRRYPLRSTGSLLRWFSIATLLATATVILYELVSYSRARTQIPRGTTIAGLSVGGMTSQDASQLLLQVYNQPIEIRYSTDIFYHHTVTGGFYPGYRQHAGRSGRLSNPASFLGRILGFPLEFTGQGTFHPHCRRIFANAIAGPDGGHRRALRPAPHPPPAGNGTTVFHAWDARNGARPGERRRAYRQGVVLSRSTGG